jgi:hypothetical protein
VETLASVPFRRRALFAAAALLFGSAALSTARAASWTQTPASGGGDVAVGPDGRVWLAGHNGTVWWSNDGLNFTRTEASGFERLSVGRDGTVWAVGANGTLWKFVDGRWTQTPASGMGDVAAGPDGRI